MPDEVFAGYAEDGPLAGQWLVSKSPLYNFTQLRSAVPLLAKPAPQETAPEYDIRTYRFEAQNRDGSTTAGLWRLVDGN